MPDLFCQLRRCLGRGLVLTPIFFLLVASFPLKLFAAEFNVGPADSAALISVIDQANSNGEADVINLSPSSSYELTAANNNTYAPTGLPVIKSEIIINGNGSTISRNAVTRFRILAVESPGNLTIDSVTLSNGFSNDSNYGGGALFNLGGRLNLNNSDIANNYSLIGGGAGIWDRDGFTVVTNSSIQNNNSGNSGETISSGGAFVKRGTGTFEVLNTTITSNQAKTIGGAIYANNTGIITIQNSSLTGNFAENQGGGIFNFAGTINIENSVINDNRATITGSGFGLGGGLYNASDGIISITDSEVSNNSATNNGGFLENIGTVTLNNNCISGNTSPSFSLNNRGSHVTATNNYWGAADGPSGVAPGSGDAISGNIAFVPFLTECGVGLHPEPDLPSPIVFLPGLGASWDTSAMITGGTGDDWKPTPFVKVYDNFRNTFLNNGYTKNEDYFEFYYDWRKRLDELDDQLNDYINSTVLDGKPDGTKVNLVGHSMGGLLARTYAQNFGTEKINKIVTLGSPHKGALTAWTAWEGAEVSEKYSWGWTALQLYLQIHKYKYDSPVNAVQGLAPSLQDLIPTFDFAKNNSGEMIDVATMNTVNVFLNSLNQEISEAVGSILNTYAGIEQDDENDTIRWIGLAERGLTDKLLGKWVDGKPNTYEYTPEGDFSIIKEGALMAEASVSGEIASDHVHLLENSTGIQAVLDALDLDLTIATETNSPNRNPSLIFFLHSPAQLTVTAPDGQKAGFGIDNPMSNAIYSEENKMLVIFDAVDGDYDLQITGTGEGEYTLDIGQLTESKEVWNNFTDTTTSEQVDNYSLIFDASEPQELLVNDQGGQMQINLAKNKLANILSNLAGWDMPDKKKKPLLNYLFRLNNLLDKASENIDRGKFKTAQRYLKTTYLGSYNLRLKIDAQTNKTTVTDDQKALVKGWSHEMGQMLIDSWDNVFISSGLIVKDASVENNIKIAENTIEKAQTKLAGETNNIPAGVALELSQEMLQTGKDHRENGNKNLAYAYSLISKILALESVRLK